MIDSQRVLQRMTRPVEERALRILILGGAGEATALTQALAPRPDIETILSLAGRTSAPVLPPGRHRIGGFGGVAGLADYLAREKIDALIDATHPFAAGITANACAAAEIAGVPIARFTRPPWRIGAGDRWSEVAGNAAAAAALGQKPRRCFLTIGRLGVLDFAVAPQHFYLVRSIDDVAGLDALPLHHLVLARPPFSVQAEIDLLRAHDIDVVVSKNSGGAAGAAKLDAARALGLPVIMIAQPAQGSAVQFHALAGVLAWIEAHRAAP